MRYYFDLNRSFMLLATTSYEARKVAELFGTIFIISMVAWVICLVVNGMKKADRMHKEIDKKYPGISVFERSRVVKREYPSTSFSPWSILKGLVYAIIILLFLCIAIYV